MTKTIAIANDHAGLELKNTIKEILQSKGYKVLDVGVNTTSSVDYPDFGIAAADKVAKGEADLAIIICGTGIGISIAANRNPKIRAALCHNELTARMAREHNDANILALGARVIDKKTAQICVETFIKTEFKEGRHKIRVEKLGKTTN